MGVTQGIAKGVMLADRRKVNPLVLGSSPSPAIPIRQCRPPPGADDAAAAQSCRDLRPRPAPRRLAGRG